MSKKFREFTNKATLSINQREGMNWINCVLRLTETEVVSETCPRDDCGGMLPSVQF